MKTRVLLVTLLLPFMMVTAFSQVDAAPVDQKLSHNLYIIFDASGSMFQIDCSGGQRKIKVAKEAIITFLAKVPPQFNLGLHVFDEKGSREIYPLGNINRQELVDKVKNIRAGGKTPLCAAIDASRKALLKQKQKQLGYGEYTMLIVTDGEANRKQALPSFVQKATDEGFVVQVIGFCP
ncbi:VWA domain-containing protein [candidate division CSSED10-310 bacterium]|uniref:VWA domain-containing protein n=1 Tax=candidate division CSSED10-310 bacterium TaxID=2855610 RepID=A0ABV6YXT7_UNCC1